MDPQPVARGGRLDADDIPKTKALFDVSCGATNACVAVGRGGVVVTSANPTGGGSAWTKTTLPGEPLLRSVSCALTLCVAGTYNGELWVTHDALGGAAAWTPIAAPANQQPLIGLTCQSESLCVAGGEGSAFVSTDPTGGSGGWPSAPLPNRFQIVDASCPSASLCALSSNNGEVTVSTYPTGGSQTWLSEHLIKGVTNALFGLSCRP